MEAYESDDDYTYNQMNKIKTWFNNNIGTDYEVNPSDDEYYIVFFDLTKREVTKLAKFEFEFRKRNM